jgi:hypothetical protein
MRTRTLVIGVIALWVCGLVWPMSALAYYLYGEHGFGAATQTEKHGFRGWLKTVKPRCPDFLNQHTLSNLYIAAEWGHDAVYSWVEIGCFRGEKYLVGGMNEPCCYWAYCPSNNWEDYTEKYAQARTKDVGTWQKYGIRRDGTNASGDFRWKFFIDGELIDTIAVAHPGYGHPSAGGEVMSRYVPVDPDDRPHMNAQGKNIGTSSDSDYYNFMTSDETWYKWSTSYGVYDDYVDDGITFDTSSPYYSVFQATGE